MMRAGHSRAVGQCDSHRQSQYLCHVLLDVVWITRRTVVIVSMAVLVLAACSQSAEEQVLSASCGPQTGMSGDLPSDIVGMWRLTWTGSADGGPSQMLITFDPDGNATTLSVNFGTTPWVYHIKSDEVRMTGVGPGVDLQALYSTWRFTSGIWQMSVLGYGDTTLERCDNV